MSECNHVFDSSCCIMCGCYADEIIAGLCTKLEAAEARIGILKRYCIELEQDRDNLQAVNIVLWGALEQIEKMGTYCNNGYNSEDELEEEWAVIAANALATTPTEAGERVQGLVEALEKLARLGNGDMYGNSDGNVIAQDALAKYKGEIE